MLIENYAKLFSTLIGYLKFYHANGMTQMSYKLLTHGFWSVTENALVRQ